jgi:hypothetical protein
MATRTVLVLAGTAVLGLVGFTLPAAAACDPPQDVRVPGAEAHWTECHNGKRTQVEGWVKDTRADGKCAQVYAMFSNGSRQETQRACPRGNNKPIRFNAPAGDAQVYLRTIG